MTTPDPDRIAVILLIGAGAIVGVLLGLAVSMIMALVVL